MPLFPKDKQIWELEKEIGSLLKTRHLETGCLAVNLELIINTRPLDPDGRDVFFSETPICCGDFW